MLQLTNRYDELYTALSRAITPHPHGMRAFHTPYSHATDRGVRSAVRPAVRSGLVRWNTITALKPGPRSMVMAPQPGLTETPWM